MIIIYNQLKFKKHIKNICKKASLNLHALSKIRKFLTVEKARILSNAVISGQFNYAPLIWVFASKIVIKIFLKIQYRTLSKVCSEYRKSYEEPLQINKGIFTHQKPLSIFGFRGL